MSRHEEIDGVLHRAGREWRQVQDSRPYRVLRRYSSGNGNLLASGMSYQSVFAVFAAIWVGFALTGLWLRTNTVVFDALVDIIRNAVPGLVGPGGAISEHALRAIGTTLSLTGIIAAVSLLWTAVGWLSSTRTAVRAMFQLGADPTNFARQKLRDLGLAFGFGVALIVAAAISVVSTDLLDLVLGWIGVGTHSAWSSLGTRAAGLLIMLMLNFVTLAGMYRVLSRVVIPRRGLAVGAGLGAVSLSVLSVLSGLVLHGASKNPLLASFAVFVGLLLWFNLVCKVILFGAAWIAVGMSDRGLSPRRLSAEEREVAEWEEAHHARVERAQEEVASAITAHRGARGMRRALTRGALHRAYRRLGEAQADRPPSEGPPRL